MHRLNRQNWLPFSLLFVCSVLYVEFSVAQETVYPNTVGLYYDVEWGTNCLPDVSNFPAFRAFYVVAHFVNCSSGVGGWELGLLASENIAIVLNSIPGNYINVGVFPNLIVGLGQPLICDESTVLASLYLYAVGPGSVSLIPADPTSLPNSPSPGYVCYGTAEVEALTPLYGGWGSPSLTIGSIDCPEANPFGGGGVVRTAGLSWSAVKSLFR